MKNTQKTASVSVPFPFGDVKNYEKSITDRLCLDAYFRSLLLSRGSLTSMWCEALYFIKEKISLFKYDDEFSIEYDYINSWDDLKKACAEKFPKLQTWEILQINHIIPKFENFISECVEREINDPCYLNGNYKELLYKCIQILDFNFVYIEIHGNEYNKYNTPLKQLNFIKKETPFTEIHYTIEKFIDRYKYLRSERRRAKKELLASIERDKHFDDLTGLELWV